MSRVWTFSTLLMFEMDASFEWWASKSSGKDSGPRLRVCLASNFELVPLTFKGILKTPPKSSAVNTVENYPVCFGLKLTQKFCFSSGLILTKHGVTLKYGTTGH